jgi:hypothetical protein
MRTGSRIASRLPTHRFGEPGHIYPSTGFPAAEPVSVLLGIIILLRQALLCQICFEFRSSGDTILNSSRGMGGEYALFDGDTHQFCLLISAFPQSKVSRSIPLGKSASSIARYILLPIMMPCNRVGHERMPAACRGVGRPTMPETVNKKALICLTPMNS